MTPLDMLLSDSEPKLTVSAINRAVQLMIRLGSSVLPAVYQEVSLAYPKLLGSSFSTSLLGNAIYRSHRTTFLLLLKQAAKEDVDKALDELIEDLVPPYLYTVFIDHHMQGVEYLLSRGARWREVQGRDIIPQAHMLLIEWEKYRKGLRDKPTSDEHPDWESIGDRKFFYDTDFTELEFMSRPDDFDEDTLTGWL